MNITLIYGMTEISSNKKVAYLASLSTKNQSRAQKIYLKKKNITYSRVITDSFIHSKLARENIDCRSK